LQAAVEAAGTCQIFFSIGTSGLVEPAASLAYAALSRGALVVEINPAATPLTDRAVHLRGPAGQVLPALMQAAWPPEPGMEQGE
jgi:NAD-dependent deacetylase